MCRGVLSLLFVSCFFGISGFSEGIHNAGIKETGAEKTTPLASLKVIVKTEAEIYIDGMFYQGVTRGSFHIDNVEPGTRRVQLVYPDGSTEMRIVELGAGSTSRIDFTRPPPINKQKTKKLSYKRTTNYFSASAGVNAILPINETAEIMQLGCSPSFHFDYNLAFTTLVISLGCYGAIHIESAKNLSQENYNLYSLPIGLNIAFRTNLNFPFMLFIEANSGPAFNLIVFKEKDQSTHNKLVTKYFMMPALGAGYSFTPDFSLFFYSSFVLMFFDNSIFQGVTFGVRADFGL